MSHPTLPSANQAASALFRLGLTLTGVLGCMFVVVHFGDRLHVNEAALYGVAGGGAVLILYRLVALFRQLASPLAPPAARRPLRH
ncbi:MAG TPA: hypothetical protein VFV15_01375 [Moraxellaceae bacterium]|nr:hypothetical protein [Moraxellaceae bacterium]